jgi:uncharacterized membrane protein
MKYSLLILFIIALSLNNCSRMIPARHVVSDLSAIGNEPFWSLNIAANEISFHQLGQEPCIFPYTPPSPPNTYQTSGPCGNITIVFSETPCSDNMSNTTYPFSVSVQLNDQPFSGCGFITGQKPGNPQ